MAHHEGLLFKVFVGMAAHDPDGYCHVIAPDITEAIRKGAKQFGLEREGTGDGKRMVVKAELVTDWIVE